MNQPVQAAAKCGSSVRRLLLVALVVCALPVGAQAQWASSRKEHDWRISIGDCSFGLVQEVVYTISLTQGNRHTTVYFGPYSWTTGRFQAKHIATAALVAAGVVAFSLAGWFLRKERG